MELELIDPECFLSLRPGAYDDFADAIMALVYVVTRRLAVRRPLDG